MSENSSEQAIHRGLTAADIDAMILYLVENINVRETMSKEAILAQAARVEAACQQINLENATDEDYD